MLCPLRYVRSKFSNILGREDFSVEYPRIDMGHISTNVAMKLKMDVNEVLDIISKEFKEDEYIDQIDSKNGFINIKMSSIFWMHCIQEIDYRYGSGIAHGKVNVEYVSANPTGPLHLGHCVTGVIGDALSNVYEFVGYDVDREYLVNDSGNQVEELRKSILNEGGVYKNEYIDIVSEKIKLKDLSSKSVMVDEMLSLIKEDMLSIGINHNIFTYESNIHKYFSYVEKRLSNYIKDDDGAKKLCLPNVPEKILIKSNGNYTYFAGDISYHANKIERGYNKIVNVQGADHIGHIQALEAAVRILDPNIEIHTVICQMVHIIGEDGNPCTMSKRNGTFISIREFLEKSDKDTIRYSILSESSRSHRTIDLRNIHKSDNINSLSYIQYTHARTVSLLSKWNERKVSAEYIEKNIEIIRKICEWQNVIEMSSRDSAPWYITRYLSELCNNFNRMWSSGERFISDDKNKNNFYSFIAERVQIVIRIGLRVLGIESKNHV